MNILEFEVHNQTLTRIDTQEIINKNRHDYKCVFTFEEGSEWVDLNKFALFTDGWGNTFTVHLGTGGEVVECLVPNKVLKGSYFKISLYAGDLITTNNVSVMLLDSGYQRKHQPHVHPHHHGHSWDCGGSDIFVEIFERLDRSVDSIIYDNHQIILFNRDDILESIYLPFLERDELAVLVEELVKEFVADRATHEKDGLMSCDDKIKLDSIEENANYIIVDNELDNSSDNPVANRVITDSLMDIRDDLSSIDTDVSSRLDSIDVSIEDIARTLDGKEDAYDYVERLDNVIVDLINNGH